MRSIHHVALVLLLASTAAFTQITTGPTAPSVTVAPIGTITVQRGKSAAFEFNFRVARGFHINSNAPKDEYLIPTSLKLNPPSDVVIGKIQYPTGQDISFAFAPGQPINVYSGDVTITGMVRTMRTASTGVYRIHGTFTYQACDNAACYPPKRLPVQFDIKVVKSLDRPSGRRNPGQSPNIHR